MKAFNDSNIEDIFNNYPEPYRKSLLEVRQLIFDTANKLDGVGEIEESLKWNQPTYSTTISKSGTPIRIDRFQEDKIAIFFHCQTTLVENFRIVFKEELKFSKNRAVVFNPTKALPIDILGICIAMALTYHKKNMTK